jgi:uncharacterized protein (DUF433 family)
MSVVHKRRPSRISSDEIRAMLSLREATLLADVPEAKVRKDIETGLLPTIKTESLERLLFRWEDVYALSAVYAGDLLPGILRRKAFDELESLLEPSCRRQYYDLLDAETLVDGKCKRDWPTRVFASRDRLQLGDFIFIDLAKLARDLAPRVKLYAEGLSRIEEREGVLGGEAVFRNTRLSVKHIGKMRDGGQPIEDILEDYPYLHKDDVEFARLYHKAHPPLGRPRREEEAELAGSASSR